jgi:lauroyl/myristoyl acyltransferase
MRGLLVVLDRLPWPWGERILTGLFAARAVVQVRRLRQALRWVAAHPGGTRERWGLALSICAHHGRVVGRLAAVGLRDPVALRPYVVMRGEEHLRSVSGGAILLGFHLGMPIGDVILRMLGHRVRWLGGRRAAGRWSTPAWRPFLDQGDDLVLAAGAGQAGVLRRACHALLEGEKVYLTADGMIGGGGREAFRVPLPGGPLVVRSGWLTLRRHTRAAVLPVICHREGRRQVVTVHPPLPEDGPACERALGRLLEEFTRRFPEQCYSLVFRNPAEAALAA